MFATRRITLTSALKRTYSSTNVARISAADTAIIKATVPILETGGETLTKHFYKTMLHDHPEVVPFFNKAHQSSGDQPRALANAVLMYARNIEKLENLGPLVNQIINKHVSLDINPEHYAVVGSCLLQAIREVLGPEIATDAVISAWGSAYGQLADILIGAEKGINDAKAAAPGGWRSGREFVVKEKVVESSEITSFILEPADQKPILAHEAGQYLGLHLKVQNDEVRRNYSISCASNGKHYRISVKREPGGVVSNHLHDEVKVGSSLELYPPSGEFTLKTASSATKPLVFLTAGVGITPAIAMLQETLLGSAESAKRDICFIHCARTKQEQAFRDVVDSLASKHANLVSHNVYSRENASSKRLSAEALKKMLPANRDTDVFLLGTKDFMKSMKKALLELDIPAPQIHWEFFGPAANLDN